MRRAVGRRSAPVSTRRARMRTLPGALNTQRNATRVPPVTPRAPVPQTFSTSHSAPSTSPTAAAPTRAYCTPGL
jgi:hypothetical protein